MAQTNIKVDAFIAETTAWQSEYSALRELMLTTELVEEFKWMHPCYTLNGKNVVLIHAFKSYIALLFHKGVLLTDAEHRLVQQTANVQAARQLRFQNMQEIEEQADLIKRYVEEAIEIERAGRTVEKKTHEDPLPEELAVKFKEVTGLEEAFRALTPGRQRAYILHFSQAKQSKTRTARVEKYMKNILEGKGMNDR